MQEIVISARDAGQRFDKYLSRYLGQAPKSFLYRMLRKKNIVLNGRKAEGNEKICEGDIVRLFLSDETIAGFQTPNREEKFSVITEGDRKRFASSVIYEDPQILVLNKPVGVLSQKAHPDDVSLVEELIDYLLRKGEVTKESLSFSRPSICNRLDRNTSGIVLAGKTSAALREMSAFLRERSVKKEYLCIVAGELRGPMTLDGYLKKDEKKNQVLVLNHPLENSAYIQTEYLPLVCRNGYTLLLVHLITGRSHQIRAHLASIHHPVAGDRKYGNSTVNRTLRERFGVQNQLLHAAFLTFPPIEGSFSYLSGKRFFADPPQIFSKTAAGLFGSGKLEEILLQYREGEGNNGNLEFERP